jgi:hypothetical protein
MIGNSILPILMQMQKSKQQIKIEQLLKEAERESSSSKRQDLILQMIRLLSEIS